MRELIDALFLFMGENRGGIAAVVIASLVVAFIWSIFYGVRKPVFARRRMFLVIRCVPNEGGTGLSLVSPRCC